MPKINPLTLIKETPILKYAGYRLIFKQVSNIQESRKNPIQQVIPTFKITKTHFGGKYTNVAWVLIQAEQCCQTASRTGVDIVT